MDDHFSPLDMTPDEFRNLGYEIVDRIASHLDELRDIPVAPKATPQAIRDLLGQGAMPETSSDPREALKALTDITLANTCLNAHPRMWGYITGSPSPVGALADLVAASANPNVAGWNGAPIATEIEHQAVQWISQLLGYSDNASGILTSGGNMSNFIGVLAARKAKANWDIRQEGIDGHGLVLYATRETHAWIEKAADLFGFGTQAIHYVETDARQRMDIDSLANHIRSDRNAGLKPFLVVGTAGTTSTGAIDPLLAIANICQKNDLWFHVDGCYGAPGVLAPHASDDLCGLRLADSLAIDAHKWLYVPLEAGCTLVRDSQHLTTAFSTNPSYYELGNDPHSVTDYYAMGPQNSRGFRALKVWMTLKQAGREGYREAITQNITQAARLYELLDQQDDFEATTLSLSITTFRYVPRDIDPASSDPNITNYLNELNATLMNHIQRSGDLYLSNAVTDGTTLLRSCIVNFRTSNVDIDSVPTRIRRLAEPLDSDMRRCHQV